MGPISAATVGLRGSPTCSTPRGATGMSSGTACTASPSASWRCGPPSDRSYESSFSAGGRLSPGLTMSPNVTRQFGRDSSAGPSSRPGSACRMSASARQQPVSSARSASRPASAAGSRRAAFLSAIAGADTGPDEESPTKRLEKSAKGIEANRLLYLAVGQGCCEDARLALSVGAEVNKSQAGFTPIHKSAHMGDIDMTRVLIDQAADVNLRDSMGQVPLHHASRQLHTNMIQLLLRKRALVDVLDNEGESPVRMAVAQRHTQGIDITKLALCLDYLMRTSDNEVYELRRRLECLYDKERMIREAGALQVSVEGPLFGRIPETPRKPLSSREHPARPQFLSADKRPVVWDRDHGLPGTSAVQALERAFQAIQPPSAPAKEMPKKGLPPSSRLTAREAAEVQGNASRPDRPSSAPGTGRRGGRPSGAANPAVLQAQLRLQARLGTTVRPGDPAEITFFRAAQIGELEVIRSLLRSRVHPDVESPNGGTALHSATENVQPRVVQLLLRAKADQRLPDRSGCPALRLAVNLLVGGARTSGSSVDCSKQVMVLDLLLRAQEAELRDMRAALAIKELAVAAEERGQDAGAASGAAVAPAPGAETGAGADGDPLAPMLQGLVEDAASAVLRRQASLGASEGNEDILSRSGEEPH